MPRRYEASHPSGEHAALELEERARDLQSVGRRVRFSGDMSRKSDTIRGRQQRNERAAREAEDAFRRACGAGPDARGRQSTDSNQ